MQGGVNGYWADEVSLERPGSAGNPHARVHFYTGRHFRQARADDGTALGQPEFFDAPFIRVEDPGQSKWAIRDGLAWIDDQNPNSDSRRYPKQWEAYKSGRAAEEAGTPLADWPAIVRGHVEALRARGIYTVEQLATLPDSATQFHGALDLRAKAQKWLEARSAAAPAADIEALRREMDELKAANAKLAAAAEKKPDAKRA